MMVAELHVKTKLIKLCKYKQRKSTSELPDKVNLTKVKRGRLLTVVCDMDRIGFNCSGWKLM